MSQSNDSRWQEGEGAHESRTGWSLLRMFVTGEGVAVNQSSSSIVERGNVGLTASVGEDGCRVLGSAHALPLVAGGDGKLGYGRCAAIVLLEQVRDEVCLEGRVEEGSAPSKQSLGAGDAPRAHGGWPRRGT